MWVLLKDFLLVSMGMGIGIVLMCILNVGKEDDCEMKQLNEFRTKFISMVFIKRTELSAYGDCSYRYLLRVQA